MKNWVFLAQIKPQNAFMAYWHAGTKSSPKSLQITIIFGSVYHNCEDL